MCENNIESGVAITATKPEFLALEEDILVALATVSIVILSPGMAIKILYLCKPVAL